MPFQQIIMHALQCQHDVDIHLLFCFDIDLHAPMYYLDFLTDGYHFAGNNTKQTLCHFDKLPCMYCNAHMIYIYTYFVLTSINLMLSCFVHVQQHVPPQIAGAGHPCYDRSLFHMFINSPINCNKGWLQLGTSDGCRSVYPHLPSFLVHYLSSGHIRFTVTISTFSLMVCLH